MGTIGMYRCFICGAPNNNLGKCRDCQNNQTAVEETPLTKDRFLNINNENIKSFIFVFLGIVVIAGVVAFANIRFFKSSLAQFVQIDQDSFKLNNKEKTIELTFAIEERAFIEGNIFQSEIENGSIERGGVILQLNYLPKDDYVTFTNQFSSTNQCPASFYNSYMKHLLLISFDPECASKISGKNTLEWQPFQISGRYARFKNGFNEKGIVAFPTGNYRHFIVDSCSDLS
jgi:hypothetical protein